MVDARSWPYNRHFEFDSPLLLVHVPTGPYTVPTVIVLVPASLGSQACRPAIVTTGGGDYC